MTMPELELVPTHLLLDSMGETRIFAILKADRRQVGDRRMTARGGRRATDPVANHGVNRVAMRAERSFLEPVAVPCR